MKSEIRKKLAQGGALASSVEIAQPVEPVVTEEERYRLEGIERQKTRQRMEQEERDERARTIAENLASTTSRIDPVAEAKALQEAIKSNPSRALTPPSGQKLREDLDQHYRYNYAAPLSDPLMEKEPAYVQREMGYVSPVLKPSITLTPQPAPRPYGEKPHAPQDIPLTGIDLRNAELQIRPESKPVYGTKACAGCGEQIAVNLAYHMRNGQKCYVDTKQ